MFPGNGSRPVAPPFPRTGPGEPGSPRSTALRRRYDFPPAHSRSLICFASGHRAIPPLFVLASQRSLAGGGPARARAIDQPAAQVPASTRVDVSGISQVPWRSIQCLCRGLRPRRVSDPIAMAVPPMLPSRLPRRRPQHDCHFEAQYAASASAAYASRTALPPSRQGSLPVGWLAFAGRESNPLDRVERFQSDMFILLSRSWPGAR